MTLWTSDEALEATGGRTSVGWVATGVSIDSRTLTPGDMFVALEAERDGHDFVAGALAAGAAVAMVSRVPKGIAADAPLLIVEDVLAALEALGRAARARSAARVAAVTGSVGKTSAKEMLRTVLSEQGQTHAAEASYNNHWGVPLTLARMPRETQYAIIEIGMNHPGEISPLAKLARPDVAMITTVAAVHLEAFDDIEGIAREKAAIFEGLEPEGCAVYNADLPSSSILQSAYQSAAQSRGTQAIAFGRHGSAWRLIGIDKHAGSLSVTADLDGVRTVFELGCSGQHFAMNALGCLAVVKALGADVTRAAQDMARWEPPQGRGERSVVTASWGSFEVIDDAYNANPTSVAAALEVLADAGDKESRRIAVLGDMLELGARENEMHAELADLAVMERLDVVHCVGKRMQHLWDALPAAKRGVWMADAPEFLDALGGHISDDDIILVKGSKSSRVSLVVTALQGLAENKE